MGLLQHATKVFKPGRTFIARMYATGAKVKRLSFYTSLSKGFRSDLLWWHVFIKSWNEVRFFHSATLNPRSDYYIQMDASGSWGCGAYFSGSWLQLHWSAEWSPIDIMAKELVPIVLSCAVWNRTLSRHSIEFRCDSLGVVEAVKKGSSKDSVTMHLLRCLWFQTYMNNVIQSHSHKLLGGLVHLPNPPQSPDCVRSATAAIMKTVNQDPSVKELRRNKQLQETVE